MLLVGRSNDIIDSVVSVKNTHAVICKEISNFSEAWSIKALRSQVQGLLYYSPLPELILWIALESELLTAIY